MSNNLLYSPSSSSLQPSPPPPPLPLPIPVPRRRPPNACKAGLKRGPWTPQEDRLLTNYINKEGEGRWRAVPKMAGLLRCGKSCRLRWMNYLRPSVKRGHITPDEEDLILRLHRLLGNRWSLIAGRIPGRTDNEIKNYWNTHIRKKMISQGVDPTTHKPLESNNNKIYNSFNLSLPINEPIQNNDAVGRQIITNTNDDDEEDEEEEDEDENEDEDEEDVFSAFLNSLIKEDEGLISPANQFDYVQPFDDLHVLSSTHDQCPNINSEFNYFVLNNNNNHMDDRYDAAVMDSAFGLINDPNI